MCSGCLTIYTGSTIISCIREGADGTLSFVWIFEKRENFRLLSELKKKRKHLSRLFVLLLSVSLDKGLCERSGLFLIYVKNVIQLEGKSFKFKTKGKTCFFKVTGVRGKNKIFCNMVSIEKKGPQGDVVINVHKGLDRRLYIYEADIYSTSTNRVLEKVDTEEFDKLLQEAEGLKSFAKKSMA